MATVVILSLVMNTKVGDKPVYSLTSDGKETRYGATRNVDMDAFWAKWQTVVQTIVAAKVDGWDQIRLYSPVTCRPIWEFEVTGQTGDHRSFSIYGDIRKDARLEDRSLGTLAAEYSALYDYMTAPFNGD